MEQIIEYDTDQMESLDGTFDLVENRASFVEMESERLPEVTIIVQAYKQPEQARQCVESILLNTHGIDYELILIDNGSADSIYEYFMSVPYEKKRIYRITKNIGSSYPLLHLKIADMGRYVCLLPSDMILTPHWLDNMLTCMKSNRAIGMVQPLSNNVSKDQNIDFAYTSLEELQEFAGRFNISDSKKWTERLWFMTLGTLYRKEVFLCLGWPLLDIGFMHYCADIDICMAVRRAGYKLILAQDTWICHNHPHAENEQLDQIEKQTKKSWKSFQEKYFGIDLYDGYHHLPFVSELPLPRHSEIVRVLGINVRSGQPLLDVKAWLGFAGYQNVSLSAITTDPKYWVDLRTVCDSKVFCGSVEDACAEFSPMSFDYVIADQPLNQFENPERLLKVLFSLAKHDGAVYCRLRNTASFRMYLTLLGEENIFDKSVSWNITLKQAQSMIEKYGKKYSTFYTEFGMADSRQQILNELRPNGCGESKLPILRKCAMPLESHMTEKDKNLLQELMLPSLSEEKWQECIRKMLRQDYIFLIGNDCEVKQPLNILFVAEHMGDGVGKAIGGLARLCRENGDIVRILLLDTPKKTNHIEACEAAGVEIVTKDHMNRVIGEADVVVLNWWGNSCFDDFLRDFPAISCRILLWLHKNGIYDPPLPLELVECCDQIAITSPISFQLMPQKSKTLIYGIGDFDPKSVPEKTDYTLQPGVFRIGYIGTPSYKRFPLNAVKYFSAVLEKIPEAKFILIGEYSDKLRHDIEEAGMADRVQFLGWVPDAYRYLRNFDVFGYLLRADTYATTENSVLEAMAAGVPVVMPSEPLGKHIVNEVNGCLYEDETDYAEYMKALHDSEDLRRIKGLSGKRKVEKYDAGQNADRFRKLCKKMRDNPKTIHKFAFLNSRKKDFTEKCF